MIRKSIFGTLRTVFATVFLCIVLAVPLSASHGLEDIDGLRFSELDELGRCGAAEALITPDTLAEEERGPIGHIRPSGWKQAKYEGCWKAPRKDSQARDGSLAGTALAEIR